MSSGGLSQHEKGTGAREEWLPPVRQDEEADKQHRWAAFEAEAMPHLGDLFRHALWLTRDRSTAEDLVQDTCAEALESFHRYTRGTNCRAWLVKILYHLNGKRRRRLARLTIVDDIEERLVGMLVYEPSTPQGLTQEEVLEALGRLPLNFQEVVVLSDVEDFTYKEISATLDMPLGTVMSRLHRARKMLRVELSVYAHAHGVGHVNSTIK